jgi:hypothetical protein
MLSIVTTLGCSSSSKASVPDAPPPARAYVSGSVTAGTHASTCNATGNAADTLSIGTPTSSVDDGSTLSGGTFGVSCTVHANADGTYDAQGTVSFASASGGSFTFSATSLAPPPRVDTNVHASLLVPSGGPWSESDCTLSFSGEMNVAAGRIWAIVTCPDAQSSGATCATSIEMKLENCAR